uniref:Ovule protein n=1 Tax=Taenia asiatica TaxID=60517 RepID=A0A0R3WFX4_TAEAS
LPVVGKEYVGLPIGRIPPDFSELFGASVTINESELVGEEEEWKTPMTPQMKCWLLKLRVMSSVLFLGASTHQVSVTRDKSIKGKLEKLETEEPLSEKHNADRSTTRRFIIVIIINSTTHSSPPLHYANYLLAPATVTIIAVPVVQQ